MLGESKTLAWGFAMAPHGLSALVFLFIFQFKLFLQSRMLAYQDGLTNYAESQIKTARDTYTLLAKTMTGLKQMDI